MYYVGGVTRKIVTAYEPKDYLGLTNEVRIDDDEGERVAYIRPPSWVYNFARQVAKTVPANLQFYLEQESDKRWVFGIERRDKEWYVDLFTYRRSELPYWALPAYQRHLEDGTECEL